MRKVCTFMCGIIMAALVTGCGATMPDLTQEETELISEYAVGVLLKYDKHHGSRLIDTSEYDTAAEDIQEETPEEVPEEEPVEENPADSTEVVDVSQDEEPAAPPSTIEEYYGIQGITFQYMGYDLTQSYPSSTDDENLFFAMDATEGMQLLVLRFAASNISSEDKSLNMMDYGVKFRVSVNGESGQNALSTMLLDDMQTYNDVLPAGAGVELVSIVEVPKSISVETIDFILRGDGETAVMTLQ